MIFAVALTRKQMFEISVNERTDQISEPERANGT